MKNIKYPHSGKSISYPVPGQNDKHPYEEIKQTRDKFGRFVKKESKYNYKGHKLFMGTKGYPSITLNCKKYAVHIIVWEEKYGKKPEGYDIHHKDFNKLNFKLSNLELLIKRDHRRLHAGWMRNTNGVWIAKPCNKCKKILCINEFYIRKINNKPYNYCRKCQSIINRGKKNE